MSTQKIVTDNATGAEGQSGTSPSVAYTVTADGQVTGITTLTGAGQIIDVATATSATNSTSPTSVIPTTWKSGGTSIPFTPVTGSILLIELWAICAGQGTSTGVALVMKKGSTTLNTASVTFTSTSTGVNMQHIRASFLCVSSTSISSNAYFASDTQGTAEVANGFQGTSQPVTVSSSQENMDITVAWSGVTPGTWTTYCCLYSKAQLQ